MIPGTPAPCFISGLLPESVDFFQEMTVQLSDGEKQVVNDLIFDLISGGSWPYIGAMWLSTLITEQQTFLNLVNPSDTTITLRQKVGTPTFTSGTGWTGLNSNSHRLSSLGNANDSAFKMAQQDNFWMSWVNVNGTTGNRAVIGTADNRHDIRPDNAGNLIGQAGGITLTGGGGNSVPGLKMLVRLSSSDVRLYNNKTLIDSSSSASTNVIPASPVHVLTNNNSFAGSAQTRLEAVGQGSMSDTIRESMVDAITTFITRWDAL